MKPWAIRWRRLLLGTAAAAVPVLLTACAADAPQDFLNHQAGPNAQKADALWDLTFFIAVVIFVIVEGALVFALIRFRHKPGREPAQFHGNTKLEVVLTLIPALILAGLAIPTLKTTFAIAQRAEGALDIVVTARQFWWQYDYVDFDFSTANELHIPTGRPVHVDLRGADVIHSFWIPRLTGAQDTVPGREQGITFQADEPGKYLGQCKEFCGLSHANMRLVVYAHEPDDFDRWVQEQSQPAGTATGDAAAGEKLFLEGECVNCHAIKGTDAAATSGPDLTHFASRETFGGATFETNPRNLTEWLRDPPAMKPGALMPDYGLSDDEIEQLVTYLLSLR